MAMKRQAFGVLLTVGLLGAVAVLFLLARSARHKSLLASLPPIRLEQFNHSTRLLVSQSTEQLKREPLRADRWGEMGYVLLANGQVPESGRCFARAEELAPTDYRWPHLLGVTMRKTDRAAAIAAFERALKAQPNMIPTLGALAETYLEDGATAAADALLRPLVSEKTTDARLLWLMARIEADAGSVDRALDLAKRAADFPPHRRTIHTLLSQLYHRKGDAANAQREARLLELLPPAEEESPWPDPIWAQAFKYSRDVDVVAAWSRTLISGGDQKEALRLLEGMAPQDRETPAIRAATATAKAYLGDFDGAQELLRGSPDAGDPNVLFSRGVVALLQQKHAEAADLFLELAQRPQATAAVRSLDGVQFNRATCLQAIKRDDEAMVAYEEALKLNPGNFTALLKLSELYLQKGRKSDAARLLADAALLAPTDDRVKELQRRAAG